MKFTPFYKNGMVGILQYLHSCVKFMPTVSYTFHKYFINKSLGRVELMKRFWKKNEKVLEVVKCMLIAYVLTSIFILVLAFLLFKFSLTAKVVGAGITIIYIVSCMIGGYALGKKMLVKKFLWGMVLGIGYFAVLFLVSLVVENSVQTSSSGIFLMLVLCAVSGMFGGMLS